MSRFHPTYLVSYFVGEGLSAFIPAILALGQGVGEPPKCRKIYNNESHNITYELHSEPPVFSIEIFIYCLLGMFLLSGIAFHLLQYDCIVKGARQMVSDLDFFDNKLNLTDLKITISTPNG